MKRFIDALCAGIARIHHVGRPVAALLALLLLSGFVSLAHAGPTHELMTSFDRRLQEPGHGSLILGPDGFYWGTTAGGGAYGYGAVYKVKADGSDWQTVVEFTNNGTSNTGANPYAGLVDDGAGCFWGTTAGGGAANNGTVFKVNASTGVLTTVLEFTRNGASNKGATPIAGLVNDGAGYFWGTTQQGGATGWGTVYKVNASTGALTTIVEFTSNGASNKGAFPVAGLVSDGTGYFWGTTNSGGATSSGTIFKVNASTGALTTVLEFTRNGASNKGANPNASLVSDGAGFFWGTTSQGGASSCGTVFKVNATTGALTTLVNFTSNRASNKGATPIAGLVNDGAGYFWGTTQQGGATGWGTVYKVNASTGALTTLVEFTNNGASNKGRFPSAGLVSDGAGSFWGTTNLGGASDYGTVYKVNASTGALTTLVELAYSGTGNKGAFPRAGLMSDDSGYFWGTTNQGGAANKGTVYKVNASNGALTTVLEFTRNGASNKGAYPYASLVSDGAGFFWGTTQQGGASDYGTVYKVNANTGELTTVVEFTNNGASNKGAYPYASLVGDGAGYFWGTTYQGGAANNGTVYKVNASTGELTTVVEFTNSGASNKGAYPYANLVSDGAGYFWGTTSEGGAVNNGTVYKVNTSTGELTTLVEFTGNGASNKGGDPIAGLVSDGAGFFWGTTRNGGAGDYGTVYKVNASTGALTTEVEFTSNGASNKGATPIAGLVNDGAGSLWGTTNAGGAANNGTVFKVDVSTGALTTVLEFTGVGSQANNGAYPGYGSLLKHKDCNFYGTTQTGGPGGGGTIFRLRLAPTSVTQAAGTITSNSGTLNGTVNPNSGGDTAVSFQYGTSPTLSEAASVSAGTVSNGGVATPVSATLTGLAAHTTYYCRVVASNPASSIPQEGAILSFTTLNMAPVAPDGSATAASGQAKTIALPFATTDNDGDAVTLMDVTAGAHLAVSSFSGSSVTFTSEAAFAGTSTLSYTVSDAFGGSATGAITVNVSDNDAPVISGMPGYVTVSTPQDSTTAAATWIAPTASDNVGVASLTSTHSSGAQFPVGVTLVTYTAKDAAGNTETASFTVTVLDGSKPVFSNVPGNITAEATSADGVAVSWTAPTANDNVGVTSLTASHLNGSVFPKGTTTVTYTAKDAAGNTAQASFTVTVDDTTKPTITAPAGGFSPLTLRTASGAGGTASLPSYIGQADTSDAVGVQEVTQSPAPGAALGPGLHTVTLTATDAAGNAKALSFGVTVVTGELDSKALFAQGEEVPGAGAPGSGIPAGAKWRSFGLPAINGSGQTAFLAALQLESGTALNGVIAGSPEAPALLLKAGDAAPGAGGALFAAFKDPLLNEAGRVAFEATLSGKGITGANNRGIWTNALSADASDFRLVARLGGPAPAGEQTRWKSFASAALASAELNLLGTVAGGSAGLRVSGANDQVLCRYAAAAVSGEILGELLLREGRPFRAGEFTGTLKSFAALANVSGSPGHRRQPLEGGVHVKATLKDGRALLLNNIGVGGVSCVEAASGDALVDANLQPAGTLVGFGPAADASAEEGGWGAVFRADVKGSDGKAHKALAGASAGGLSLLLREGDAADAVRAPGALIRTILQEPVAAPEGYAAVVGLRGTGVARGSDTGLYWRGANFEGLLAREGSEAPGAGGARYAGFVSVALPDGGTGPVFTARLQGGKGPAGQPVRVTARDDLGLWAADSSGAVRLLVRENGELGTKRVLQFAVLAMVPGSPAQARSYNDRGEIVAKVTYTDRKQAIVRFQVP